MASRMFACSLLGHEFVFRAHGSSRADRGACRVLPPVAQVSKPNATRISPWNIDKYHWLPAVCWHFCQPILPPAQRAVIPQPSPAGYCH